MCDVFISYSSKDQKTADAIVDFLESEKISCWIAPRDVGSGNTYAGAITRAIKNAHVFVLVFSEDSNSSEDVLNEIASASEHKKPIIPFRIDETKPNEDMEYYIKRRHWLDAINGPMEDHLKHLASDICKYLTPREETMPKSNKEEKIAEIIRNTLITKHGYVMEGDYARKPINENFDIGFYHSVEDKDNPLSIGITRKDGKKILKPQQKIIEEILKRREFTDGYSEPVMAETPEDRWEIWSSVKWEAFEGYENTEVADWVISRFEHFITTVNMLGLE